MKKMILLVAVLFIVSLAAYATGVPEAVTYKAKNGDVTFFHIQHLGIACVDCHHTGEFAKCSECHNTKTPADDFHKFCIACHKTSGVGAGCITCHKK